MSGSPAPRAPEVVCLGESMSMLAAATAAPLRTRPPLSMYVGGAESNVACGLAHLGHDVEWISRLGDDPLGQSVVDFLQSRSVRTTHVVRDAARPTGVYFKDSSGPGTTVYYYRTGSAASVLSVDDVAPGMFEGARLVHLSGITPALSGSCDDLMTALVTRRAHGDAAVSFDVNYRPALWSVDRAAPRLRELALEADIVVVGRDEAATLWGTTTPHSVRDLFPDVPQLVVKDDDVGATHFSGDRVVFEPALTAEVVEPVGAGDAFAAGFLSGWLRGMPTDRRLRHGHLLAALTLRHVSDLPTLPDRDSLERASALSGESWEQLDIARSAGDLTASMTYGSTG